MSKVVGCKSARPLLSLSNAENRRRAINLYKAWYRHIPYALDYYDIPVSIPQARAKLKEEFLRHKNVTDTRVLDMLIIKGQMDLKEMVSRWKPKGHVMSQYFKETHAPKPNAFLAKFYESNDF